MARRNRGGGGDEGGNWMDTYGDLVTLLLTFFVLLYSMSNLDQNKWKLFVRSIYGNSDTKDIETDQQSISLNEKATTDMTASETAQLGDSSFPEEDITGEDIGNLYLMLAQKLNESGISDVQVTGGVDYTYISFRDKAFFEGDSSVLTAQGKQALDVFVNVIEPEVDQISQINIMGHTAQAYSDRPNTVRGDRMLSSMRATEVCIYLQEKDFINPADLVCISYGQFRPVAPNDSEENRQKNRRVELLILDKDATGNYEDYVTDATSGNREDTTVVTDGKDKDTPFGEEQVSTALPKDETSQSSAVSTEAAGTDSAD
jgi:chemotaxis protein MotB